MFAKLNTAGLLPFPAAWEAGVMITRAPHMRRRVLRGDVDPDQNSIATP